VLIEWDLVNDYMYICTYILHHDFFVENTRGSTHIMKEGIFTPFPRREFYVTKILYIFVNFFTSFFLGFYEQRAHMPSLGCMAILHAP